MKRETVLEIEFQPIFDKWGWRVIKQNEEILKRDVFEDKNIGVYSSAHPYYNYSECILDIRGYDRESDNLINICTDEEKIEIEIKVRNINEKYGIKKRWRAKKDNEYYYIDTKGEIVKDYEDDYPIDEDLYNFGNYFETEEEAEKYKERIEELLTRRELDKKNVVKRK